eukprot:scaffold78476_cov35-Prasinocladus_malaysianus.AAC.2
MAGTKSSLSMGPPSALSTTAVMRFERAPAACWLSSAPPCWSSLSMGSIAPASSSCSRASVRTAIDLSTDAAAQ